MAKLIEGKAVNLRETVEVKGVKHPTARKQKMVTGRTYNVHPLTAENLVKTGHAEYADKKSTAKAK